MMTHCWPRPGEATSPRTRGNVNGATSWRNTAFDAACIVLASLGLYSLKLSIYTGIFSTLHGVVFAFFVQGPSVHYGSFHHQHIHRHRELLLARADDDAGDRRDVGEVAPDRQDDVVVLDQQVIGRVEPDPADRAATPYRNQAWVASAGCPNRVAPAT